jgi:hypothetical protein
MINNLATQKKKTMKTFIPQKKSTEPCNGLLVHRSRPSAIDVTLSGCGVTERVVCQINLLWMLQSSTTYYAIHGGESLKNFSTFVDWAGYLNSTTIINDDVKKTKATYGISQKSSLSLVAHTTLRLLPFFEFEENVQSNDAALLNGKRLEAKELVHDTIYLAGDKLRLLAPIDLNTSVTYNSQYTEQQNKANLEAYIQKWSKFADEKQRIAHADIVALADSVLPAAL